MFSIANLFVGNDHDLLRQHAVLEESAQPIPSILVKNCLTGIDNYPLDNNMKNYLKGNVVFQCNKPTLWRLERPYLIFIPFHNGEWRQFLVTRSGLIVEKYTNYSWYKHIPFITALSLLID